MLTLIKMADTRPPWHLVTSHRLVELIQNQEKKVLIIDSRSFLEFNTCHISEAVNVCCSKLVKRRLQQGKVSVKDLLTQSCTLPAEDDHEIIVYDQCTEDPAILSSDCFLTVLLRKLNLVFKRVSLLKGGFLEFQATHASLCESKQTPNGNSKCPPLTSMSQPCMPVSNVGPTKVLQFLYLGSQKDALSQETMQVNGISYVLNVSNTCPKPPHIQDSHFLRIPVNDNYCDKLLPYFQDAFQFLDKVREANGCVLVHCLAGISRSPTLAIAYIMKYLNMSSDDAYRYVKDKRPTISPNFNFLGQLLDYEKQLKSEKQNTPEANAALKRQCIAELRSPTSPTVATPKLTFGHLVRENTLTAQSPTSALAKLTFASAISPAQTPTGDNTDSGMPHFPQFPTTSLDKLNFTPCFAKDDFIRSPDSKPSSGTKRPLSTSSIEQQSWNAGFGNKVVSRTNCNGGEDGFVSLRSPETKAKRPLVRPNSIAFSSYPKFDSVREEALSPKSPVTQTDNRRDVKNSEDKLDMSRSEVSHVPKQGTVAEEVTKKRECCISGNLEQNRKSRSYEDILNSPYEENKCENCVNLSRKGRQHILHVVDTFSPPAALERAQCHCRGMSDSHQSNSSISSSGSHNSLHGSLELIPVS